MIKREWTREEDDVIREFGPKISFRLLSVRERRPINSGEIKDIISAAKHKLRADPNFPEHCLAGVYRYFLSLYENDESAATDAFAIYLSGSIPKKVTENITALQAEMESCSCPLRNPLAQLSGSSS